MLLTVKFWLSVLTLFPPIISFLGIVVGIYIYKNLRTSSKYIFFYLIAAFSTYILSRYLENVMNNNLLLVPVFGFLELFFFSMIYHRFLFKKTNYLFLSIVGFLLLLIIIDIFTCNPFNPEKFQSYGRVIDSLTLVSISIYFYWKVLKNDIEKDRNKLLLNGFVLLFFLLNSVWFLVINFLVNTSSEVMFPIWLVNAIAMPLFYLYLIFYLWQSGKIQKQ